MNSNPDHQLGVIASFTLVPIGGDLSLSPYIAACEDFLASTGLSFDLHANGTNIEGDWEEVLNAIRKCHEIVHTMGVPRIHTSIQLGTRTDRVQTMKSKIESVRIKQSR